MAFHPTASMGLIWFYTDQPLFTTADEIRSTSTERGKTIESFKFPDELLAVMGYHPGTDLAKAKLHPRLDDWYNGKAAAHEASLSPKARRTSDSSGTSGQTISSGQTASSAQSTSSGSTSRGPRSAPRIETQRKASRRIARPAAVSPAVQPFPLGRTLNFTYMPGHTSTTPHHSPYHSPSVGKLSPFTYEYPSPHLPIQPKLSISHIIHHPADEQ